MPSGVEQICRRVDLHVRLVGAARWDCRRRAAPSRPAAAAHSSDRGAETRWRPPGENVFVAGSYRSAFRLAVAASSSFVDPPVASTLPFGRIVAFISMRGCDIDGPVLPSGAAPPRVDDFRRGGCGVAAAENHHARLVAIRRRQRQQHGRAVGPRAACSSWWRRRLTRSSSPD